MPAPWQKQYCQLKYPAKGWNDGGGQGADEQFGPYGEPDVVHAAPDGTQKKAHEQQMNGDREEKTTGNLYGFPVRAKDEVIENGCSKRPDFRQQEDP